MTGDADEIIPQEDFEVLVMAIGTAEWLRRAEAGHSWPPPHGEWVVTRT